MSLRCVGLTLGRIGTPTSPGKDKQMSGNITSNADPAVFGATYSAELNDTVTKLARQEVAKAATALVGRQLVQDADRQSNEDQRAIRRNRNRMFTLFGAILIGLLVVWTLPRLGGTGKLLEPYSFVITVLMDTAFTVYAYFRRY